MPAPYREALRHHRSWEAFEHPTGLKEFLPVILAQGVEDGPCLVLSAGLHRPEHSGPMVLYRLLTDDLVGRLRGTIVAFPGAQPGGAAHDEPRAVPRRPGPEPPVAGWPAGTTTRPRRPRAPYSAGGGLFSACSPRSSRAPAAGSISTTPGSAGIPFILRDRVLYRETGISKHSGRKPSVSPIAWSRCPRLRLHHGQRVPGREVHQRETASIDLGAALLAGRVPR